MERPLTVPLRLEPLGPWAASVGNWRSDSAGVV